MFNINHVPFSKLVNNIYFHNYNNKKILYKYISILLHVTACSGHLQGGGYQRKE